MDKHELQFSKKDLMSIIQFSLNANYFTARGDPPKTVVNVEMSPDDNYVIAVTIAASEKPPQEKKQ